MKHPLAITTITIALSSASLNIAAADSPKDYYQKSRGYRVEPDGDPPNYTFTASKTQFNSLKPVDWLQLGLDFRARWEYRENDLRRRQDGTTGQTLSRFRDRPDNLLLLRTRAYLGVKNRWDPLRFAVEFEDARSLNGRYERTDADVNEGEFIQGYGELFFKDAAGKAQPVSLRAGRMHLELLDRRLVGNNQFRNTTNNFDGIRLKVGDKRSPWEVDTFAFRPVQRLKYQFDRPDEDTLFWGSVVNLRSLSQNYTVQPYILGRNVNGDPFNSVSASRSNDQNIFSPGLRVYGTIANTGWDYDIDLVKQLGTRGASKTVAGKLVQIEEDHNAEAVSLEAGYTFNSKWKPRASLYYGYGSGDRDPNDTKNERLDTFFGFNQPWSRNDYYSWDNIHAPKARIELKPHADVRVDAGYNAYWLASDTDGWNRANLRDRSGNSGSFMGQELDVRLIHKPSPQWEYSLSYAHFAPGEFTRRQDRGNTQNGPFTARDGNFAYLEVSWNAFRAAK